MSRTIKVKYQGGIPGLDAAGLVAVERWEDYIKVSSSGFRKKELLVPVAKIKMHRLVRDLKQLPQKIIKASPTLRVLAGGAGGAGLLGGLGAAVQDVALGQVWLLVYEDQQGRNQLAVFGGDGATRAQYEAFRRLLEEPDAG